MGGSGGGGGYRSLPPKLEEQVAAARAQEAKRLNAQVNEYLAEILAVFNDRDAKLVSKRLDKIADALHDIADIDRVLFGGSVAKHTDVDGISDVDALIVLDRADLEGKTPAEVRTAFYAELDAALPRDDVQSVRKGSMAVTIVYRDGMEIQLLPAIGTGKQVAIGTPGSQRWSKIDPKRFASTLTSANQKLGNALVPAIKLMKSICAELPPQKRLNGYHIEALAVDAAKQYKGQSVPREVLVHLFRHAADRVKRPISDITGQSRQVDEYLGSEGSIERLNVAQALAGVRRRLEAASSLGEWKSIFSD